MCPRLMLYLCILFCLAVLPTQAVSDTCPPLPIAEGQVCECIAYNYGKLMDCGVRMDLDLHPGASVGGGPACIDPQKDIHLAVLATASGYCTCFVTGETYYTRTTLAVMAGAEDPTPLVAVPCN